MRTAVEEQSDAFHTWGAAVPLRGVPGIAKWVTGGFQVLECVASPTAGTCFQTALWALGGS